MRSRDAFVIMPFSDTANHTAAEWLEVYDQLFRPALDACGYSCARTEPQTGSLIESIIRELHSANLVLADVTDQNVNVFYELGVRHSLSKRTIIVSQDVSCIPSDLRGYWALVYSPTLSGAKKFNKDIQRIIADIEAEPERTDNPVAEYLERENLSAMRHIQRDRVKKLGGLITEISGNMIALTQLHCDLADRITQQLLSNDCLSMLLSTLYVDVGPRLLKIAYETRDAIKRIQLGEVSQDSVTAVQAALEALGAGIVSVHSSLESSEYEEPPSVSTMVWAIGGMDRAEMLSRGPYVTHECRRFKHSDFAAYCEAMRKPHEDSEDESPS